MSTYKLKLSRDKAAYRCLSLGSPILIVLDSDKDLGIRMVVTPV